jgi:transcriptional regulator PpsR
VARKGRGAGVRSDGMKKTTVDAGDASRLQVRLLEAQATIERDYTRLRELEARYRHLFEQGGARVVVDATSLRVLDANATAAELLGTPTATLIGTSLPAALDARTVEALLAVATAATQGMSAAPARVATSRGTRLVATATLFRQDGATVLLLQLVPDDTKARRPSADPPPDDWSRYAGVAADGLVLTDLTGKIRRANAAFVELVQLASERQLVGESLGRWLGRTSVDLGVLVTNLRQRGLLRLFATQLRSEYGSLADVEISAALLGGETGAPLLGFTVRDIGRRLAGETRAKDDLSRSVGQLTELVGRVPMKEIVGNTASLIEKMCIEAALQLTRDNRAAAAELLGLSRQSLYVKLRRYGIGGGDLEEPEAG